MDRRRFLKVAGLAGLAVMSPIGLGKLREVHAGSTSYEGPYWIPASTPRGGGTRPCSATPRAARWAT